MWIISTSMLIISISWKIHIDRKTPGKNYTIKILYLMFFCIFLIYCILLLFYPPELAVPLTRIGGNTILIGPLAMLGYMLIFELLDWKAMKPAPVYFLAGIFIFYFATGMDFLYPIFIFGGAFVAIIVVYIIAICLKDNGAFRYTVFQTFLVVGLVLDSFPLIGIIDGIAISDFIFIMGFSFGIIIALGKFKPFKENKVVQQNSHEITQTVDKKEKEAIVA